MAAKSKSNVITLTRVYDAPLQSVWDAWTIPRGSGAVVGPARLYADDPQP